MLDLIVVALLQAVAGDPAQPAEQPQAAQTEQQAQASQSAQETTQPRRRCRARQITGTRIQTLVTCRTRGNSLQDDATREALHDLQRPAGAGGN